MTLSTPAEHKAARDADRLAEALEERIRPTVTAEEFVFALEGTEDVDAEAQADELWEDVYREARKTAKDWGEGHVADSVAEELADRAGALALEMLREAPTVEVRDAE